jgi:putative (di)nucleoside polyphosphate hydrolase
MAGPGKLPYRPCVGVVLFNPQGLVWMGRRVPKWSGDVSQQMWQLPQGGIDTGESPREAAMRELKEETGTDKAEIVAESRDWHRYDLPPEVVGKALKGRFGGQSQKWFAMLYRGRDDEFDIGAKPGHKAEFDAWQWTPLPAIAGLVVPFKRPVYEALIDEFADIARLARQSGHEMRR